MNKQLIEDEVPVMQVPSAPPAYDDEFKPPAYNPPPYNPQMVEGQMQAAGPTTYSGSPYPPQMFAVQAPAQSYAVMTQPTVQPPTQIITQTERVFLGQLPVGPQPLTTTCPHCQASIKTNTRTTTHCSAHLLCLLMFCFVCWCCSCLPYCMDSFHTVHHHCPNCKAFLGAYQKH